MHRVIYLILKLTLLFKNREENCPRREFRRSIELPNDVINVKQFGATFGPVIHQLTIDACSQALIKDDQIWRLEITELYGAAIVFVK